MNNFMIGQYGKYDFDKFNRDYRKGFYGIEAFMMNSEEDIDHLIAESKKNDFSNVKVMFEHRSDLISDEELEACYSWVNELLNGEVSL